MAQGALSHKQVAEAMGQAVMKSLSEIDHFRVTGLRQFERCPHTWAAKYLAAKPPPEKRTGAAAIGTAAHLVAEHHLGGVARAQGSPVADRKWPTDEAAAAAWAAVPKAEHDALLQYLDWINELAFSQGWLVIGVETEFRVTVVGDMMPPVVGHRDVDWWRPSDETLLTQDHKTNRGWESVEYWKGDLQPQLYAYSARRQWKHKAQRFAIGYVNLGTTHEWDVSEADEPQLLERVRGIWDSMQAYAAAGEWPRQVCKECGWCPVKDLCPELKASMQSMLSTAREAIVQRSLAEQRVWLKDVIRAANAMVAEVEDRMREELASGPRDYNGATWRLRWKETRKAQFTPVYTSVIKAAATLPQDKQAAVLALLDDSFTAKVGGLDRIAKLHPDLAEAITRHIVKVRADEPSIEEAPAERKAIVP